jgi:hypothetical protein
MSSDLGEWTDDRSATTSGQRIGLGQGDPAKRRSALGNESPISARLAQFNVALAAPLRCMGNLLLKLIDRLSQSAIALHGFFD